ncbi:MAG: cryptochrome/photolyase family protein, partial [Rhodospirillales bacterium]
DLATESGGSVLPVFILDDDTAGAWAFGGARRWWLHASLTSLARDLEARGASLTLRRGRAEVELAALVRETGAKAIVWTRRPEPHYRRQGRLVAEAMDTLQVRVFAEDDFFLHPPDRIKTGQGKPYAVFTPFWRALQALGDPPKAKAAPEKLPGFKGPVSSDNLADWGLLPGKPDWAGGLRESWQPGEAGAQERLGAFIAEQLDDYAAGRDELAAEGTSRLSPHLAFGEISPRQIWHAAAGHENGEPFLRQLGWREFSHHQLLRNPSLPAKPLREAFEAFPWRDDEDGFRAWCQGRTGYPVVDAGMRELWVTGTMHNRARMIVGSFLVKDLMVHWRRGEDWFWDTLCDANLANNAASWQWIAGCGIDAAPYFRVFNPVRQGEKFDPDGAYVRRWVPELASLPNALIHAPWEATEMELAVAGVRLGETYPAPVIDHKSARDRALAAFKSLGN